MKHEEIRQKAIEFMEKLHDQLKSRYAIELQYNRQVQFKTGEVEDLSDFPVLVLENEEVMINVWATTVGWDFGGIYYISISSPGNMGFVRDVLYIVDEIVKQGNENIEIGIGFEYHGYEG